jgi:hypothetical protein
MKIRLGALRKIIREEVARSYRDHNVDHYSLEEGFFDTVKSAVGLNKPDAVNVLFKVEILSEELYGREPDTGKLARIWSDKLNDLRQKPDNVKGVGKGVVATYKQVFDFNGFEKTCKSSIEEIERDVLDPLSVSVTMGFDKNVDVQASLSVEIVGFTRKGKSVPQPKAFKAPDGVRLNVSTK